jgi:hypothetical protein
MRAKRQKRPHMKANLYPKLFLKREGVPFDQNFANKWFALQKSFFKLFSGFLVLSVILGLFGFQLLVLLVFKQRLTNSSWFLGFTLQKSITG